MPDDSSRAELAGSPEAALAHVIGDPAAGQGQAAGPATPASLRTRSVGLARSGSGDPPADQALCAIIGQSR